MPHYFYPRPPCGERPSTSQGSIRVMDNFYPRPPCGERLSAVAIVTTAEGISIHALLAESDLASYRQVK